MLGIDKETLIGVVERLIGIWRPCPSLCYLS